MSALDDYIELVDYLAKQNAQAMILKLTNVVNGTPPSLPPSTPLYVGAERAEGNNLDRTMIAVTRTEKYRDGLIAVIPHHLIDAVTMARNTFEAYAALHREKHTPDGDAKAALNDDLAKRMNAALAGKPIK